MTNRERLEELMDLAASGCLDDATTAEFESALAADPALRAEADADCRLVGALGRAGQIVRATRRAPKGLLHGALAHARAQSATPSEVETSPLPNALRTPQSAKVIDMTPAARSAGRRRPSALPWMMAAAALVVVAGGASFLALQVMQDTPKSFEMADASLSTAKSTATAATPSDEQEHLLFARALEAPAEAATQPMSMMAAAPITDFDGDGDVDLLVAELVTPAPALPDLVSPDGTPPGTGEVTWDMAAATPVDEAVASAAATEPAEERYFDYGNFGEPRHEAPPEVALNFGEEATEGVTLARADNEPAVAASASAFAGTPPASGYAPDGTPMRAVPASAAGRDPFANEADRASGVGSGRAVASAPAAAAATTTLAGATMATTEASVADALAIAEVAATAIAPDEVAFLISQAVTDGAVVRSARAASAPARTERYAASAAEAKSAPPLEELTLEFPDQGQYQVFRWRVESASMARDPYSELRRESLAAATTPRATTRGQRQTVAPSQTPPTLSLHQAPGGEKRDRGVQAPPATMGLTSSFAPSSAPTSATATMMAAPPTGTLRSSNAESRRLAPATAVRVVPSGPVLGNRFATEVETPPDSPRVRVRIRALPGSE